MADLSQYTLPNDTGVCFLDCCTAFKNLTDKEKRYAHYISQASWYGGLIVLFQTSPESPGIFVLLQKVFRAQPVSELKDIATAKGLSDDEFKAILVFAAGFYANMGNYKSFGDSKIIPNLPKAKFELVVLGSAAAAAQPQVIKTLWDQVSSRMYGLEPQQRELGLGEKGTTTYYSSNCDKSDAEFATEFLSAKDLSAYNTRLFKQVDPASGKVEYEVRLASAESGAAPLAGCGDGILQTHQFTPAGAKKEPVTVRVTRGDYSPLMALVVDNLNMAKSSAANEKEVKMLEKYMECFQTGSIPAHKDGSRFWIQNKGPIVETYIGFIESYRDPFGVRGEFEGFVAVVNKEMSAKFGELVDQASHLLGLLPWPASYEKDKFLRPDFTSLDVLTFGGSGIPAGINIPNYDDIRQDEGFKNVSLGNVLTAGYKETKVTFLSKSDTELYTKLKIQAFEVQVGLHELLGHGSGKLFVRDGNGDFNFDIERVKHTETGEKISCWYEANDTWDSKFTSLAATYEECRAECVGIYLCLSTDALKIFGHDGDGANDIIYINWLNMVRSGLLGLEFYSPERNAWRQAHMQGRFVILQVLMEAGEGLVQVKKFVADDGENDICLTLDRTKINTVGKEAIGNFLRKLQVYKSTGDVKSATEMYERYSDVHDAGEPHFLSLREIVLARKQPRKMFVQHNTVIEGDGVTLKTYESSAEGLIQSNVERFPDNVDDLLQGLWEKEKPYFPSDSQETEVSSWLSMAC